MPDAAFLTALLRSHPDVMWQRLRALLEEQGIDPGKAALAESRQQGDDSEFGVIVTSDGDVYEFSFVLTDRRFSEWVRITDRWRDTPYRAGIEEAHQSLRA